MTFDGKEAAFLKGDRVRQILETVLIILFTREEDVTMLNTKSGK